MVPRTKEADGGITAIELLVEAVKELGKEHDAHDERIRKLEMRSAWLTGLGVGLALIFGTVELLARLK